MSINMSRYAGAQGLVGLIGYESLPSGTSHQMHWFIAQDGGESRGLLYARGGEKGVVLITHPRASFLKHYAVPYLLESGHAVFVLECRYLNNDTNCIHERLMFDIAAAVKFLRGEGYASVVSFGNSGGGSLLAMYQSQAETAPPARLTDTPAGDPCDLNEADLPPFDGAIIIGAHLGEGLFMMEQIDPSVVDENNPALTDNSLDMYNPANGYRGPEQAASYSKEFVQRYRAAQRDRVARLDALAHAHIAQQRLMARAAEGSASEDCMRFLQQSILGRTMVIYRTEADLRACDLSIEPSRRNMGSMESIRPEITNYADIGHARIMSARGWLSTWSGLSSRAGLPMTLPAITVPTLFIFYAGDNGIFPSAAGLCLSAAKMKDRSDHTLDLDHCGREMDAGQGIGGREKVKAIIGPWLQERFS
jgi:pimeloyl-ACP methyl ester carboxylesterase